MDNGILVLLEPDESVRDALLALFRGEQWSVETTLDCNDIGRLASSQRIAAVISESSLPTCQAAEVLETCKIYDIPLIFTGHDLTVQGAVDLIRQGAADYLEKPFPQRRLLDLLSQLRKRHNSGDSPDISL